MFMWTPLFQVLSEQEVSGPTTLTKDGVVAAVVSLLTEKPLNSPDCCSIWLLLSKVNTLRLQRGRKLQLLWGVCLCPRLWFLPEVSQSYPVLSLVAWRLLDAANHIPCAWWCTKSSLSGRCVCVWIIVCLYSVSSVTSWWRSAVLYRTSASPSSRSQPEEVRGKQRGQTHRCQWVHSAVWAALHSCFHWVLWLQWWQRGSDCVLWITVGHL